MVGLVFHLIPHTHWDREWYRTRAAFLARLVPAVDDLLDRLERDPGFRTFLLDGQTILLDDYLRLRPDRAARIGQLVSAGRLQTGPWYVLADEFIPAGESHIRNLLLGSAAAVRLGRRSEALYSPDAFGHPSEWPMLAAEFGLEHGAVWRGLGGEPGQQGDLFRWRAPDGSSVLLYHLPPDGYEVGAALPLNSEALASAWAALRPTLVSRAAGPHVAVFIGADHHAAHPGIGALQTLLAAIEPEADVRVSRLDEFLQAAADASARPGDAWPTIPVLSGELRWSYRYTWTLQGVHGTRAPFKRCHADAELRLLRIAEPLVALAALSALPTGQALLDEAWRSLVQCQFHDTIGGCAADAVVQEARLRLADASVLADAAAERALHALVGHDPDRARDSPEDVRPRLVLWNPVARARTGLVVTELTWFRRDLSIGPPGGRLPREAAAPAAFSLRAASGDVPVQILGRRKGLDRMDSDRHYPDQDEVERVRVAFGAPQLDGMAFGTLDASPSSVAEPDGDAWVRGRALGNDRITLRLDDSRGWSLRDLSSGQRYRRLMQFEWEADNGDTYTFCPGASEPSTGSGGATRAGAPSRVRVLARGPLVAAVEARWELPVATLRVVASIHADSSSARFTVEVDSTGTDYRLRLRSASGVARATALAGGAFGADEREPLPAVDRGAFPLETPVATAPAHRYVAVAGDTRGLALFAPGFFEYEHTGDGDLLFTALRAVGQLSRADLSTRPGHAGWPTDTPLAQCRGLDRFQVALRPLAGTVARHHGELLREWEDLFLPVSATWLRQSLPLELPAVGVELLGDGLVLSAIKPVMGGTAVVLRCLNSTDEMRAGFWRFAVPVVGAWTTRADERPGLPLPLEEGGRLVRFVAGAHALVSVRVDAPSG